MVDQVILEFSEFLAFVLDHISVLELAWTLVCFFGFLRFFHRSVVSWRARSLLIARGRNGMLRLVATNRVIGYAFKAAILGMFAGAGATGMTQPHGPASDVTSFAAWITTGLLIFGVVGLIIWGELDGYNLRRRALMGYIRSTMLVTEDEKQTPEIRARAEHLLDELEREHPREYKDVRGGQQWRAR